MILGVDTSTYIEELEHGAKFYFEGKEIDPLDRFVKNGVSYMRIRLWHNPYTLDGKPYLAGTCDFNYFIRLAKLAISKGYKILLDIHYSDFWVDPAKQTMPKAWRGHSFEELKKDVYDYTKEVVSNALKEGVEISMIQIGNEITNGMLWPIARLEEDKTGPRKNYDKLAAFLKEGIKATKEVLPNCKIIIHLERSYDHNVYKEFFTEILKYNVEFDIIGASYYPYWHHSFDELFANLTTCKKLFNKDFMIMELGYAFTLEDYIPGEKNHLVVRENNVGTFGMTVNYPFTPEGQKDFVTDFLKRAKKEGCSGVFFWEPLLIPGDGIAWGSKESQIYTSGVVSKEERSDWCNQCFADYSGNLLPAFDAFTIEE